MSISFNHIKENILRTGDNSISSVFSSLLFKNIDDISDYNPKSTYNKGDIVYINKDIYPYHFFYECKITSGEKVAFYEFGYGVEGRDSAYKGQLPTNPLTFESAGNIHTTQGWEYYYPNSKTKRTVGGQQGWFHNKEFVTGKPAQAQMWRTANELEQGEAKIAVEQLFKERDI